jgi:hypothetical protein
LEESAHKIVHAVGGAQPLQSAGAVMPAQAIVVRASKIRHLTDVSA